MSEVNFGKGSTPPVTDRAALMSAPSLEAFANLLSISAEFSDQPNAGTELYDSWRNAHIHRQKEETAQRAFGIFGIKPEELELDGVEVIESRSNSGKIHYSSIEDLSADLRAYFTPTLPQYEVDSSGPHVASNVERHDGVEQAIIMASMQRLFGNDDTEINRIVNELSAWDKGDVSIEQNERTTPDEYFDSYDYGGGDPYKYHSGYLGGHCISVARLGQGGGFGLKIHGGGMAHSETDPTYLLDDFEAYVGKEIAYEDATLKLQIPVSNENIEIGPKYRWQSRNRNDSADAVDVTYEADMTDAIRVLSLLGIDVTNFQTGINELQNSILDTYDLDEDTKLSGAGENYHIDERGICKITRTDLHPDEPSIYKPVLTIKCIGGDRERLKALRYINSIFRRNDFNARRIRHTRVPIDAITSEILPSEEY